MAAAIYCFHVARRRGHFSSSSSLYTLARFSLARSARGVSITSRRRRRRRACVCECLMLATPKECIYRVRMAPKSCERALQGSLMMSATVDGFHGSSSAVCLLHPSFGFFSSHWSRASSSCLLQAPESPWQVSVEACRRREHRPKQQYHHDERGPTAAWPRRQGAMESGEFLLFHGCVYLDRSLAIQLCNAESIWTTYTWTLDLFVDEENRGRWLWRDLRGPGLDHKRTGSSEGRVCPTTKASVEDGGGCT